MTTEASGIERVRRWLPAYERLAPWSLCVPAALLLALPLLLLRPQPHHAGSVLSLKPPSAPRQGGEQAQQGLHSFIGSLPPLEMPQLPQAPPVTQGAPATSLPPPPVGSPFAERESTQEQPQITMENASAQTIYMTFRGVVVQSVTIPPFQTVTIQLPVGDYGFVIWSDDTTPQNGYGVFRKYKAYDTTWVFESMAPWETQVPLKMGDVE